MKTNQKPEFHAGMWEPSQADNIDVKWLAGNEEWWDWYISLACNENSAGGHSIDAPPLPEVRALKLDEIESELNAPFSLSKEAMEHFRKEGYVKLKDVCSPAALLSLRRELEVLLCKRPGGNEEIRFLSAEMSWLENPVAKAFVFSKRLARIAAELLGVATVRLYHDSVLSKLPGCGRTPWHYDAHHYPIDSENVVTSWIPLQETGVSMGSLAFAKGIENWRAVADLTFSKLDRSYDRAIMEVLRKRRMVVDELAYALGEASFHHTRTLHTASSNMTNLARIAFSVTYFEDGACLLDKPTMVSGDYEKFMPGIQPGNPIATSRNPVLYSA